MSRAEAIPSKNIAHLICCEVLFPFLIKLKLCGLYFYEHKHAQNTSHYFGAYIYLLERFVFVSLPAKTFMLAFCETHFNRTLLNFAWWWSSFWLYMCIPVSLTWIKFQGHIGIANMKLKVVFTTGSLFRCLKLFVCDCHTYFTNMTKCKMLN